MITWIGGIVALAVIAGVVAASLQNRMTAKSPDGRPGPRGYTGRGGGRAVMVPVPPWFRGTTQQVAGLYPWGVGGGAPNRGVPVGTVLAGRQSAGATVHCDPFSWFRFGLIANPSQFVLGLPGLGKTTLVIRQLIGMYYAGIIPLVLGDTKPDYVRVIRALGGQVITLGPGGGQLNWLDLGAAPDAARRLRAKGHEDAARALLASARARRAAGIRAGIGLHRGAPLTELEVAVLDALLAEIDERWKRRSRPPIIKNLLDVLIDVENLPASHAIRRAAVDRGDLTTFHTVTNGLMVTLTALSSGSGLGSLFNGQTTEPMRMDRPVAFDLSRVPGSDPIMRAAALMASWRYGYGQVEVAHALADAGLGPRLQYDIVQDELWRTLSAGPAIVEEYDGLTRLNRNDGVVITYITHTTKDLHAIPDEASRAKAKGFIERAGIVVCAGLRRSEMVELAPVIQLSGAEQDLVTSWSTPDTWAQEQHDAPPPGLGKFLLKAGTRSGIPFQVQLTDLELDITHSNARWTTTPDPARKELIRA